MSHFSEPPSIQHLLAKSADRSLSETPETLAQHTYFVLQKVAALARLRPDLPKIVNEPDLWHLLYWTCFLHDFGKATSGFQHMLQTKQRWGHRHEVVSLAFVDWIVPTLAPQHRTWIVAAIASHHRDADSVLTDYFDDETIDTAWSSLKSTDIPHLWTWLNDYSASWISELGLDELGVRSLALLPQAEAVAATQKKGVTRIRYWLDQYSRLISNLHRPQPSGLLLLLLLRGLTTTADHAASAHLAELPPPIQESWESLAKRVLPADTTPYPHQARSAAQYGRSTILIAPTGSGKTEAALYWAVGDGSKPIPRIFYALPYQASMNAMFDRLRDASKGFGEEAVGIQHGRALQSLYSRLLDAETGVDSRTATDLARWQLNINSLHARPLKVFSPYQMLKAMFQIKGFEAMLSDYTQASFIFDEIHAYDPQRLALILALVQTLREQFGARFFVMSATFPNLIREKLRIALGDYQPVIAEKTVFEKFCRHRLHLLDGQLTDEASIQRIVYDVQNGKKVLACATTVRRAQEVRDALISAGLSKHQVMLIHSRYIVRDRIQREKEIMVRCGIDAKDKDSLVLVATQVVEVSLNIDLDVIYTEPAPLEALLQRFGRVNRAMKKGICPVYVFTQPSDGQGVYGRHPEETKRGRIVQLTLQELTRHQDTNIDESGINNWLNIIYSDTELSSQWETEYTGMLHNAQQIINGLRPFNSNPKTECQFEQMFDNIDVLPICFEREYLKLIEQHEYVEASQYFVGISTKQYNRLLHQKPSRIKVLEDETMKRPKWIVHLPYSSEEGLSFGLDREVHDDLWNAEATP